jgi:transcriptional regulator with XRE-family HTH domain
MSKVKKTINDLSKNREVSWVDEVGARMNDRRWLRYSSNIARRILAAIEDDEDLNQKLLADKIGVTPQQISKIVKGHENLTLETIAKISAALNVELISFPRYKDSRVALPASSVLGKPSSWSLQASFEVRVPQEAPVVSIFDAVSTGDSSNYQAVVNG